MHKLYELKDKLMNELEDYSENGKFSKDDAENIKALSASIEHICNICESEGEGGYSGRMYPDGMGGNRGSYMWNGGGYSRVPDGGSYARGRGRNARRDSMGRYSGADGDSVEDIKHDVQRLMDKIDKM